MYCLNDAKNIYIKMIPTYPFVGKHACAVHGITDKEIAQFHNIKVECGMGMLADWIKERKKENNCTKVQLYGHHVSTEKKALLTYCKPEDKIFLEDISLLIQNKFFQNIKNFQMLLL